jgi:hypothetical protein
MSEKNKFGGGNKNSLYTPMSETEQEVLSRLVQARDLCVHILGWGALEGVAATFGDLRLKIPLELTFVKPDLPVAVSFFDLELRTGSGLLLFKERQSAVYNNAPLMVGTGTTISMIWDIAIQAMDPKVVKQLKPGAFGLTSRWQDRDTGELTTLGNTRMDVSDQKALRHLRAMEEVSKGHSLKKLLKAQALSKKKQ